MATSQFYNANRFGDVVKLRKQKDGNKAAWTSKVTSMIELFSDENSEKLSTVNSRPGVRNSIAFFNQQEVIKPDNVTRNINQAKDVSGGARISKPLTKKTHRANAMQSNRAIHREENSVKGNSEARENSRHEISQNTSKNRNNDTVKNLEVMEATKNKPKSGQETVITKKSNNSNESNIRSENMSNQKEFSSGVSSPKTRSPKSGDNNPESKMDNDFRNEKEARRITNARNYWEHKLTPKSASLHIGNTQASSSRISTSKWDNARSKFEASSDERKNDLSPTKHDGNISSSNQKPSPPTRSRFMTVSPGSNSLSPKPFTEKPSLSLAGDVQNKPNSRNLNTHQRTPVPISPLARSPPRSPRLDTSSYSKVGEKSNKLNNDAKNKTSQDSNNNALAVNPIPKPQRTFTFTPVDISAPKVPPRPRHKNVFRVSSDLSTINGPSFKTNLTNSFLNLDLYNSTPDISTRSPKDGYEEVVFCRTEETDRSNTGPENLMRKWQKQHDYEEVESTDPRHLSSYNYDHIEIAKSPRQRSFSDLETDNYSRLTFQQDLATSTTYQQSKDSALGKPSRVPQHMKLKKLNSDVALLSNSNTAKSDKSMDIKMKLQIADKIRDAFTQIGKKYHHNWKNNDDLKSLNGSSGDEDSDTEMDMNKHRQILDRTKTMQKTYRHTLKYKSLERELSGLEKNSLFEQVLICKIMNDQNGKPVSKVSYRFPAPPPGKTMGDEKALAQFCFPDIEAVNKVEEMLSQSYAFMLTREDGTRKFGYCRRILPPGDEPRYPVVYCLISPLGSFGLYETILDELEMRHRTSHKKIASFLETLFVEFFPAPGRSVRVKINEADGPSYFMLRRPFDTRLEHVDLQCLLYELGVDNTIKIFTSLLLERRVIICGKSLSILTACIHALRTLLYPFVWQHVFIPVLPATMVDMCCSPTPLLIGILETSLPILKTLPLEEVLIVNQSTKEVILSAGDEMEILPRKLQTPLINSLVSYTTSMHGNGAEPSYDFALDYESAERNTVISESFMHLFVEMIGHYQNHFIPNTQSSPARSRFGKTVRNFNRISFYEDVTSRSLRRFLDLFMGTQMFDGFIHSRELATSDYEGLFEMRIMRHIMTADASHLNFKVFKTKMKRFMQGIGKKKI